MHAPPLVIEGDERRDARPESMELRNQAPELHRRADVPFEENDTAGGVLQEEAARGVVESRAGQPHHEELGRRAAEYGRRHGGRI